MKSGLFDELSLPDKARIIYEFAHHLMSIESYDYRIHLVSLNGHFIELYQNIETRQIQRIDTARYDDLDKYLPRIVLAGFKIK